MDPITLGIGAIGLGMSLFGGFGAANDAKQIAANERQQFDIQNKVNAQRQQQMELSARRQGLETFRNMQRARAQGINAAVQGHAQYGSGLAGGVADVENQGFFASLGINQNLAIGRNIFGLDTQINTLKGQEASLKGDQATNQAWQSLGGSLMTNAGTIGKIGTSAFGAASSFFSDYNSLMSPGSLSGGLTNYGK